MTEVGAPLVAAPGNADEVTKKNIRNEVTRKPDQQYPGADIATNASALVIRGEK